MFSNTDNVLLSRFFPSCDLWNSANCSLFIRFRDIVVSILATLRFTVISSLASTRLQMQGAWVFILKKILNLLEDKILNLTLKGLKPVSLKFLDIKTKISSLDVSTDTP